MIDYIGSVKRVVSQEDLKLSFEVLRQLRGHLNFEEFLSLNKIASEQDDFQLHALWHKNEIVSVIGFRTLWDFCHGKHLYIDDLVTDQKHRSKGYGQRLLHFAEKVALKQDCKMLRLCSGVDKKEAHRFYEREGWPAKSLAFKRDLSSP